MAQIVTWIDRLRIERVVWLLDQRLYDLPRRSRIAKRREVRENLLAAAYDIGTRDALRHLGGGRRVGARLLGRVDRRNRTDRAALASAADPTQDHLNDLIPSPAGTSTRRSRRHTGRATARRRGAWVACAR